MSSREPTFRSAGSLAAVLLITVGALLGLGASPAAAAKPCWERVLDDWTDNSRIDGVYSVACLEEALKRVPEDIRSYSNFEDQILRARHDSAVRVPQSVGDSDDSRDATVASGSSSDQGNSGRGRQTAPPAKSEPKTGPREEGPIESVLSSDTTDARSIPIPLIILASLGALLFTAGGAGLVVRKLRARRLAPG